MKYIKIDGKWCPCEQISTRDIDRGIEILMQLAPVILKEAAKQGLINTNVQD